MWERYRRSRKFEPWRPSPRSGGWNGRSAICWRTAALPTIGRSDWPAFMSATSKETSSCFAAVDLRCHHTLHAWNELAVGPDELATLFDGELVKRCNLELCCRDGYSRRRTDRHTDRHRYGSASSTRQAPLNRHRASDGVYCGVGRTRPIGSRVERHLRRDCDPGITVGSGSNSGHLAV